MLSRSLRRACLSASCRPTQLGRYLGVLTLLLILSPMAAGATAEFRWTLGSESGTFLTNDGLANGDGTFTFTVLEFQDSSGASYTILDPNAGFVWDRVQPIQFFRNNGSTDGAQFLHTFGPDNTVEYNFHAAPAESFVIVYGVGGPFVLYSGVVTVIAPPSDIPTLRPAALLGLVLCLGMIGAWYVRSLSRI